MKRYPHTFSGRRASQSEYELSSLIKLFNDKGVNRYLEVGARDGDTFHEIMINLPVGSLGVAVDLPGGLWGKKSTESSLIRAYQDLIDRGYDVHVVLGDSQSKKVIDEVKSFGLFDAALIDGDHTYDGVRADFKNYGDLAPIVAFHDIVGHTQSEKVHGTKVEVPRFWSELSGNKIEFVDKSSTMGIGVIID